MHDLCLVLMHVLNLRRILCNYIILRAEPDTLPSYGPRICNDTLGTKTVAINKLLVENVNMLQTSDTMLLHADGFDTHLQ